jgi:hypothetical protein
MADFSIFPTDLPVGSYLGAPCNILAEQSLNDWMKVRSASVLSSFVYSGLDLTYDTEDWVHGYATVAPGIAFVEGYMVVLNSATTFALNYGDRRYQYIQLDKDVNGRVVGCHFDGCINEEDVPYSDVVLIALVNMGAAPHYVDNAIKCPGCSKFSYVGRNNTSSSRIHFLGFRPAIVMLYGPNGKLDLVHPEYGINGQLVTFSGEGNVGGFERMITLLDQYPGKEYPVYFFGATWDAGKFGSVNARTGIWVGHDTGVTDRRFSDTMGVPYMGIAWAKQPQPVRYLS